MDLSSIKKNKIYKFAEYTIDEKLIFYKRKLVYAFVNLKPIVPGHVLLSPTRVEKSYVNLTEAEAIEMWISAKVISENLKRYYHTNSVQISIQDGKEAGQTVEHCHIHILPIPEGSSIKEVDDEKRKARTFEEMSQEAEIYKQNFVYN